MKKEDRLSLCRGCWNDHYNRPGNSSTGECWKLKSSKPVTRTQVGTWQSPPYTWTPEKTLDCHTAPEGRHWIAKDDVRIKRKAAV